MTGARRWTAPLASFAVALTYAQVPWVGTPAVAAPPPFAHAPGCYAESGLDLNEDGKTDVPVGDPDGDAGSVRDAGVVEVRFGCAARGAQRVTLPHPHRGDRFGAALAGGVFDGEVLFVGVPDLDVRGRKNAGGVAELRTSAGGVTFARLLTQDSHGVPGKVQAGAHFGAALSLSSWNDERFHLRIGEPGKDVGHHQDTGGFVTLSWNDDPEDTPNRASETTLASLGIHAQDGDLFGSSFAQGTSFRAGAPGRRVHGRKGAGAVYDSRAGGLIDQATPGVPGAPEKGDHFGAALGGDWVGVPGEALGSTTGAGLVQHVDPTDLAASTSVTQDSPGVPGEVGAGHHFGAALDATGTIAVQEVFVGAPGDASGAGSVTLLREGTDPGSVSSAVALAAPLRPGGRFGSSLALSGYDHELVGAPGAEGGRIYSFALSQTEPSDPTLETSWTQVSPGSHAYGSSLTGPELDADA